MQTGVVVSPLKSRTHGWRELALTVYSLLAMLIECPRVIETEPFA